MSQPIKAHNSLTGASMSEKMRDEQCTSADATDQAEEADAISKCIGDSGRWQIQMIILLSLFNIPCTWHIYSMAFQGSQPDFWCAPPPHFEGLPLDFWRNKTHARAIAHVSKSRTSPCWHFLPSHLTLSRLSICRTRRTIPASYGMLTMITWQWKISLHQTFTTYPILVLESVRNGNTLNRNRARL